MRLVLGFHVHTGKLVRYLVEESAHIEKHQPYAEIEVMKMYLTLTTPEAGSLAITMCVALCHSFRLSKISFVLDLCVKLHTASCMNMGMLGSIHYVRPEGSILEAGDLIATLKLDHPEHVQKVERD